MHRERGGVADDRDGVPPGQPGKGVEAGGAAPGVAGDDQRPLCIGQDGGGFVDGLGVGAGRHGRRGSRRRCCGVARLSQHFARHGEIDRPHRLAERHGKGPVDHRLDMLAAAQFVVPLRRLAHQAGLVEHFLRPLDRAVAGAVRAGLVIGRAAGGEQHRHPGARRVDQAADGVGGADIDMDHDRLGPAGNHRVAVGHADGDVFVGHGDGRGELRAAGFTAGEGFDDRRKIGAGVGEDVVDMPAEPGQQPAGDGLAARVVPGHRRSRGSFGEAGPTAGRISGSAAGARLRATGRLANGRPGPAARSEMIAEADLEEVDLHICLRLDGIVERVLAVELQAGRHKVFVAEMDGGGVVHSVADPAAAAPLKNDFGLILLSRGGFSRQSRTLFYPCRRVGRNRDGAV